MTSGKHTATVPTTSSLTTPDSVTYYMCYMCINCRQLRDDHSELKCLFDTSTYAECRIELYSKVLRFDDASGKYVWDLAWD